MFVIIIVFLILLLYYLILLLNVYYQLNVYLYSVFSSHIYGGSFNMSLWI